MRCVSIPDRLASRQTGLTPTPPSERKVAAAQGRAPFYRASSSTWHHSWGSPSERTVSVPACLRRVQLAAVRCSGESGHLQVLSVCCGFRILPGARKYPAKAFLCCHS